MILYPTEVRLLPKPQSSQTPLQISPGISHPRDGNLASNKLFYKVRAITENVHEQVVAALQLQNALLR